jgi:hypothetical protein
MHRSKAACLAIFLVCVSAATYLSLDKPELKKFNPIDLSTKQYSDEHVNANAIDTDNRFKELAFAPVRPNNNQNDQLANIWRAIYRLFLPKKPAVMELGTWVWTPTLEITPEYAETIFSGAKDRGVNAVYLSLDSYLDIYTMPEGIEKENLKKDFNSSIENFISRASERGIAVDAEAGWRNWAEPGNEYKPLAIVNLVETYNAAHATKFRGIQYDIEPYLLPRYHLDADNQKSVLLNFVSLVDKTADSLAESLKFTVVIPDFYDKKDLATPLLTYNSDTNSVYGHLLNILEEKAGSSIIIMSYRNYAEGADGSIEVSKNEITTAKKGSYSTNLIIAQETGPVSPPFLTFHNTSRTYMTEETTKLSAALSPSYPFSGLAIHYANAYLELR